jgi:hypothetical protein
MTANYSSLTDLSHAQSSTLSLPMKWRTFEREVDQILGRLRDAHIRLTLVAITVPQFLPQSSALQQSSILTALTEAVRMSVPLTDPVGLLAGGSVCALLLGARPPGGLGDIMVVERLMRRVLLALSFRGDVGDIDHRALIAEAAHCWAGEVDNVQDLIDGLEPVVILSPPARHIAS